MTRSAAVFGALVLLSVPVRGAGQSLSTGAVLQTFTIEDAPQSAVADVQVLTLPVVGVWERGPWGVQVRSAYTDAIVTFGGGGYAERAGPTDTHLRASYAFGPVLVTGLADLATGDARYGAGELPLLGALGSDLLPVTGGSWGAGGSVGGEVALRGLTGQGSYVLSAGYVRQSAFEPLTGFGADYRPGNQLRVRAAMDRRFAVASVLSFAAGYQRFSGDVLEGAEVFRAGARWEAEVAFAHPLGSRESFSVSAGMYRRMIGGLPVAEPDSLLSTEGLATSPERTLVALSAEAQATRGRVSLAPELGLRLLSTGDDVGAGWLASAGARAQVLILGGRYGDRLLVTPAARLHVGSVSPLVDAASAVRGWEVGISARWERGL